MFAMCLSRDYVKKIAYYMNTKYPNICLTFEIENQNSFSFFRYKNYQKHLEKNF